VRSALPKCVFAVVSISLTTIPVVCAQVDISRLIEKAAPAVALLEGQGPAGSKQGTGFVVSADGLIVTNLHVITGMDKLRARIAKSDPFEVQQVVAFDEARDIALIKLPVARLSRLLLADSRNVEAGQPVTVLGNPFSRVGTASQGIISAVRELPGTAITVIHTNASVSPGNSGGPLLNSRGEVIGVITGRLRGSDGLAFAVPSNDVRAVVEGARTPRTLAGLSRAIAASGGTEQAYCQELANRLPVHMPDVIAPNVAPLLARSIRNDTAAASSALQTRRHHSVQAGGATKCSTR